MTYQLILLAINIVLINWYFYNKKKDVKKEHQAFLRELKYQRHLRNAFDYQIQMYAFMAEHNADGFKLASDQVNEELNKCKEILKEK